MHCYCAALKKGGDSLFGCLWERAGQPATQSSLPCCPLADCSITKFLNRILGLEVDKQNMLFQYFSDTFDYLIEKDKKEGKYDMGILGKEERGDQAPYTAPLRFPAPPCADHWLFLCSHRLLRCWRVPAPHSTDPKTPVQEGEVAQGDGSDTWACVLVFLCATDLAPGIDEIYEESKEVFLTPGHPQDGQVVFYKVGSLHCCFCSALFSVAFHAGAVSCWISPPAPWLFVMLVSCLLWS